jgi:Tfp pilus assembly protein PilF
MYENIKRLTPNDDKAYFACGVLYIGLKDGWKAREEFKKAVEINPNNAEAHYELGWLYASYEPEYAKNELKKAIELDPNLKDAKEELERLEKK